jgi:SGNH hydrolase-like domain, acetyltransferase AlgX
MLTKKVSQFSLLIFFWLILPLICVEILMIVLEPYLFKGFYQYDPDLGFRVRPYYPIAQGTITNKFGFNDDDYPLQKTPGIYRILVVGDSFGWAGGREGNYTTVLERQLDNHYGYHRIDIINAGYPMTQTAEQLVMLKKYGLQYDPDLVILGFFVGNDFIDGNPNRKRIVVNDLYMDIDKRREHIILGYPIVFQSRLLLYVKQKYKIFTELRKAERAEPSRSLSQEERGTLSEGTFLDVERAELEFFNINPSRKGRFQKNINYILQSIAEMDALLKSRNIKFIVAIYPDVFQINKTLLKAIVERFRLRIEDYDLDLAQNILKSFLQSKDIFYIDFTDRFRSEGQEKDLYILRDSHWNRSGNQLAADILFETLVKRIPETAPLTNMLTRPSR